MTAAIVAVLMWLLVASLLLLRRGRAERVVTYAALLIAIAMTLNVDFVYESLDGIFGGANAVTLAADLTLMVGVFFLGRGVARALEYQPRAIRIALSRAALVLALTCELGAFLRIGLGRTTTTFMLDFGAQPAAALYSAIQFSYYATVLSAMAVLAVRQIRSGVGIQTLPPTLLVMGSLLGISLSIVVYAMDIAHLTGDLDLMTNIAVVYSPMFFATFLLLCAGFAGGPAVRAVQSRSHKRMTRKLIRELGPIWTAATKVRPGISQRKSIAFQADDSAARLHRQVVEIRDALIDVRVSFNISGDDRHLLERAEQHLLGAGATNELPVASRTSRQGQRYR